MATIRCPNCGYMGRPERYLRWGRFLGFSILATLLGMVAFGGTFCAMVAKYYGAFQRAEHTGDSGVIFLVLLLLAPVVYALIAYFASGHRCPLCKYPYVTKR